MVIAWLTRIGLQKPMSRWLYKDNMIDTPSGTPFHLSEEGNLAGFENREDRRRTLRVWQMIKTTLKIHWKQLMWQTAKGSHKFLPPGWRHTSLLFNIGVLPLGVWQHLLTCREAAWACGSPGATQHQPWHCQRLAWLLSALLACLFQLL